MMETYKDIGQKLNMPYKERLALSLARTSTINAGRQLNIEEQKDLFYKLMSCKNHNYTPDGKKTIEIISIEEISRKLN
ncbi:MAG: DNA mismatch repair protein MutL, partial [Bacteroidales bacterium]|nr:DNA mismatch repair protein MutL [Bacteroidales bacterium]